jgi:hypothetical protein
MKPAFSVISALSAGLMLNQLGIMAVPSLIVELSARWINIVQRNASIRRGQQTKPA